MLTKRNQQKNVAEESQLQLLDHPTFFAIFQWAKIA